MNRTIHAVASATLVAWAMLSGAGCPAPKGPANSETSCDPAAVKVGLDCNDPEVKSAISLLRSMSVDEKVQQMSGPTFNAGNMFDQETNARLGIPGFLYMDGPRGVRWYNATYGTTVYPVAAARAASWDLELERRIGKAMAKEMRYLGRHILLAPTINQVSHPRWGRAQESYGEDTFLLGAMGSAFITGAQYDPGVPDPLDPHEAESTYRVQPCAKHLAANNIEDTRIYVNAVLDERTLREVYLPHFRKAAEAGVSCVMSSYNRVNGSYSGESTALVRDILKTGWGYQGWVVSDWFAQGKTLTSPVAGLDIEMPFSEGTCPSLFDCTHFYGSRLVQALAQGQVDVKLVDEAVLRILYAKVHFGVLAHPPAWTPWLTKSDATQALALQAAREGIVLLKNAPSATPGVNVLPLSRAATAKIAVVGKFSSSENMGDKGSSDAMVVDASLVITPWEGLFDALGATNTSKTSCGGVARCVLTFEDVAGNEAAIRDANTVVVVGAYYYADLARSTSGEEGEWKDRVSLSLPQRDLTNIANAVALKTANPALKVVVVLKSGGAVVVDPWLGGVDAVVMAWYAGMKEGTALGEILFGDVNPSGKLVQSFPAAEADLPPFDNTTTGDVAYGYYHGYRWLDRQGKAPRYPFGYGLSYTTFAYSNFVVVNSPLSETGTLTVKVDVENTGLVAGSEVVQLYVGFDNTAVTDAWGRPKKELKAFARAFDLAPGAKQTVTLQVKAADLAYWNVAARKMTVEKMTYQLYVGPSSSTADPNMKKDSFTIQ
jgi:beta-glucosidase